MTYQFTAKPLDHGSWSPVVALYNGAAQQLGIYSDDWTLKPLTEDVERVLENRLIDAGYCIDAKERLPAGACFGVPLMPPWAGALQITARRTEP